MKIIGAQWKVTEKLKSFKSNNTDENWQITYVTPVYGGWDLLIECKFNNLEELDKIVSFCRNDLELSQWIDATTTLISTNRNYVD
ncbi:MAG: hypothetical protein ACFFDF_04200 [Candidatus Odinarchaeota archaeon]